MSYKQILEDILELDKRVVVVVGHADITNHAAYHYYFKDLTSENFWRVIGRGDDNLILESFNEWECDVDLEGEYEFKAVLRWESADYDEYGRCTMTSYLEIEHIEFNFIQTFKERERESKLNEIFSDRLDDLF